MGQSVVKNSKKIFSQPGSDPSLNNRVTNLENNVYKITYYEIVSGTSGSITIPTGATINEGEFGTSGNSILSKINVEDKPTYSSPLTSGNVVVTANLNIDGTWTASGTYTDAEVALVYSIDIKAIDYHNLDNFYIINSERIDGTGGSGSGSVTSVGLTMPTAFTVSNSPITSSGDIAVTGAGTTSQYIRGDGTLATFPALTGYVPYTGATNDVDLGTYNLTADHLSLNVNPSGAGFVVGTTQWNNTDGTSETLLKGGNVTLKNGVDLVTRVVNKAVPNQTLTKAQYQVVKVVGATGGRLSVDLAQANNDLNSADTLGVVIETIATNQEGFIMTVGQLTGINTTGSLQGETWADGDVLYLSPTTPGGMTKVKPNGSTGHIVVLGYVEYAHAINGKIYVKIMNGWELEELHDVYIPTYVSNGVLYRDTSTNLWKTNTIPSVLGYTPANDSNVVHLTGTETITGLKTFTNLVNIGNAVATNQRQVRIGQDTAWVDIGSMPTSTDVGAIYFNQTTPSGGGNSALSGNSTTTALNATSVVNLNTLGITRLRVISPQTTGSYIGFEFTAPSNTGQTASTAVNGTTWNLGSRQWIGGNITTQKEFELISPVYNFTTASTITNAYTAYISAPTANTNATITNNYALGLKGKLELDLDGTGKFLRFTDWATPYSTYGWGIFTSIDKIRLPNTIYIGDSSYYINRFDAIGDPVNSFYGGAFNTYKDFRAGSQLNSRIFIYGQDATGHVGIGTALPTERLTLSGGNFLLKDGGNIILETTTGTKIGTSTTQKLGFYNATPIVRPSAVTTTQGIADALSNLGLLATSTINTSSNLFELKPGYIFRGVVFNNNSTTAVVDGGVTMSSSASTLAQSVASTNFVSKQIRLRYYASVVSTGRYTGTRGSALLWFIHGGFLFNCDVNISDTAFNSTCQQFYGLAGSVADLAYGGVSLTALSTLTNLIGVGSEAADTNLQIIYNDATGTCSKIDLGANFPANRTSGAVMTTVYSILLYNAPASTEVNYRVINNETGAIAEGTLTTDLPATTQGLNFFASRAMGTSITNSGQFDLLKLGVYSLL